MMSGSQEWHLDASTLLQYAVGVILVPGFLEHRCTTTRIRSNSDAGARASPGSRRFFTPEACSPISHRCGLATWLSPEDTRAAPGGGSATCKYGHLVVRLVGART